MTPQGVEEMGVNFRSCWGGRLRPHAATAHEVSVAREAFASEEATLSIDPDQVRELAVERVEQSGIVFIDDKVGSGGKHGPDISREGVQRDLLPIVDPSTIGSRSR